MTTTKLTAGKLAGLKAVSDDRGVIAAAFPTCQTLP
jgi:hypothetical protein